MTDAGQVGTRRRLCLIGGATYRHETVVIMVTGYAKATNMVTRCVKGGRQVYGEDGERR